MTSQLIKVRDALTSIEGLKVYHYFRPRLELPFCIWAEEEDSAFCADNKHAQRKVEGTIDYFTKTEFDTMVDSIEEAIGDADGIAWKLNSVDYDDDDGSIHYEWVFRVI